MVALAPNFHRMGKAEKTGLSLPSELRQAAQSRADLKHRGNFSAYIQSLITADLANQPLDSAFSPTVLADLAKTYAGYLAPTLAAQMAERNADQAKLLHDLLRDLCECFAEGFGVDEVTVAPRSAVDTVIPYPESKHQAPAVAESPPNDAGAVDADTLDKSSAAKSPPRRDKKSLPTPPVPKPPAAS